MAAPQGHFLILFSTIFTAPTASIFLLLVQKKGTKEKDTRKLVGISNSNTLRFKSKTGTARTWAMLRIISPSNKRLLWSCFPFDARFRLTRREITLVLRLDCIRPKAAVHNTPASYVFSWFISIVVGIRVYCTWRRVYLLGYTIILPIWLVLHHTLTSLPASHARYVLLPTLLY